MQNVRLRRLKADHEALRRLANLHPKIEIEGVFGNPPERYRLLLKVKSLRENRAHLKDAYARFFGEELFLIGSHISPYAPASQFGHEPTRTRKLLLHRRELDKLQGRIQEKGLTLVPLRLFWSKGRAKAELGLGVGKKLHDKRASIRERMERREIDRAMAAGRRRKT